MRDLTACLQRWLAKDGECMGQLRIARTSEGWELRHSDDRARTDLALHTRVEDARHLANLDDFGAFRPLKTARNLAHGWRLVVRDAAELRIALDAFYPAMLGVGESFRRNELGFVPLRATLGRQTGMYRVTQKISDEQAKETIDGFCAGCLKQRLWEIDGANPEPVKIVERELPLICQEACNLLVAEVRKVVKTAEKVQA
jgi:sirohydrochlorin cobaltochelatase